MADSIPDKVADLAITLPLDVELLSAEELHASKCYRRAADYLAASMIFLKSNFLLDRDISADDIKPRLLGHWGTCPGLTLVYCHTSLLMKKHGLKQVIYQVGPGHGAPAILAGLWIEGSLGKFYPEYSRNMAGLSKLISGFSTPAGFPSHVNALLPSMIHEGGELGYSLSVAFGAVMDKPDMLVVCVVGDGEAETAAMAASWMGYKYIDPKESGAVLPIVHVNGFKISERTIFGCMDDEELSALFTGYGYQPRFVQDLPNIDQDMYASMEWALREIEQIQKAARSAEPLEKARWPVLIMRTPKGWGCPKEIHGVKLEDNYKSHQVPLPEAKTDRDARKLLQDWLASYEPHDLFESDGSPKEAVTYVIPNDPIGQTRDAYAGYVPLDLPGWEQFSVPKESELSCMKTIGKYLAKVVTSNPHTFRIFSPDELESNKLDATLQVTNRNFQGDPDTRNKGGRIIEMLSENTLQGFLQGYIMTGRSGLFPSYESFLGIISTQVIQCSKFMKQAHETEWRGPLASINYIETSTWCRQEHNGFSHQNPSFIGTILNLKANEARVYLPPDANCFLSTIAHCLRSKNYVNLMVGSKQDTPIWLDKDEANKHCMAGISVWKFASTEGGVNPDVVLAGIGVEMTFEVIAAAALLRTLCPYLRVRVVNVTDLMVLGAHGNHPHSLTDESFASIFTDSCPIHFNYHGYPGELKSLLFGRKGSDRITLDGYSEEGTTTTPFSMMLLNSTSRFHVAIAAIKGATSIARMQVDAHSLVSELRHAIAKHEEYAMVHAVDPPGIFDRPSFDGKYTYYSL